MRRLRRHAETPILLGARTETAPLTVTRVEEQRPNGVSSAVEPPLGADWPDIDRLRWHAGVLLHDHGVTVHVSEVAPGMFALHGNYTGGTWGNSACSFDRAWTYLNGIGQGAKILADLIRADPDATPPPPEEVGVEWNE